MASEAEPMDIDMEVDAPADTADATAAHSEAASSQPSTQHENERPIENPEPASRGESQAKEGGDAAKPRDREAVKEKGERDKGRKEKEKERSKAQPPKSTSSRTGAIDFIYRATYRSSFPDVPFDAKAIAYPFDAERFVPYSTTSLEKSYKHDILVTPEYGVPVDLVDPDVYKRPPTYRTPEEEREDKADREALLADETSDMRPGFAKKAAMVNVSWLRNTEYVSAEFGRQAKEAPPPKQKRDEPFQSRDAQVRSILATFEASRQPITRHPTRDRVTPVEVIPFLPEVLLADGSVYSVHFDSEADRVKSVPGIGPDEMEALRRERLEMGVFMDSQDQGEDLVTYYLPKVDAVVDRKRKRSAGEDEDVRECHFVRDYTFRQKPAGETDVVLVVAMRPSAAATEGAGNSVRAGSTTGAAFYRQTDWHFDLTKRRAKGQARRNEKVVVHFTD